MLSEKLAALALQCIDFQNDQLEAAVEKMNAAYGELFRAGLVFENASAGADSSQVEKVSGGIVTLASTFGIFYDQLSPEQVDQLISAFADVFTAPTLDQEAAGENLFNACVKFIASAKALNQFVGDLLKPV